MSRMPADPVGRLAALEAARAEVADDLVLNFDEMAKVAGMTARNLKLTIDADPEFPILKQGGQGVAWEFEAAKVLDHMIGSAQAARAEREGRKAKVARLAGLGTKVAGSSSGADPAGSGPASELAATARAFSSLIDAQVKLRQEKQRQGELVPIEAMRDLVTDLVSTMQAETLAVSSKLDPAGQWEPSLRKDVDEALRNVLVTVRGRLEERLGKLDAAQH